MTFNEIIKANPEAGELAMEMVYEKLTGKCWHRFKDQYDPVECEKCGKMWPGSSGCPETPPRLLHSLDAWPPLWDRMTEVQKDAITDVFIQMTCDGILETSYYWEIPAHHHLEACLTVLEGDCPECEGEGYKECIECDPSAKVVSCERINIGEGCAIKCTCTNGKVSLYKLWERKVSCTHINTDI